MDFEQKLKGIMKEGNIVCEHFSFKESCHSVEEAAAVVKASQEDFNKSIYLVDKKGGLVVAIVKGEDRVDVRKVEKIVGERLRLANAEEILEKTGFPVGGTPPFGFNAVFFVDEKVMEKELVYAGGSSTTSLVRLSPVEMLKANCGRQSELRRT